MLNLLKNRRFVNLICPALIVLRGRRGWIGLAIGAFDPAAAMEFLRLSVTGAVQGENPFADFSIDNFLPKKEEETAAPLRPEKLNENYRVSQEFFSSKESDIVIKKENCYIKNVTRLSNSDVYSTALSPVGFKPEKNSGEPQILIYHTHATESYLPDYGTPYDPNYAFRSTDKSKNMVAVGEALTQKLNSLGYNTVHDDTLHDYPSYNGSYDKSKATIQSYLDKYPSIKVVLDVHRDAAERDGTIISPVVEINGQTCAQIMIISGADNGYMNMPNFWENLKFASAVQNSAATLYPGLMRPVLFDYRNYNQQMSTGAFLVEVGTHGATLRQAVRSAEYFGEALAAAFDNM